MQITFVCTGNVFRSLTAELATRSLISQQSGICVSSAGTEDFPHIVRPYVREYLLRMGLDSSSHVRRTLTKEIVNQSDLIIAMSNNHKEFIFQNFGINTPLFTEAAGRPPAPILDVCEAVTDMTDSHAVEAHAQHIIDNIIELAPDILSKLSRTFDTYVRS